MLYPKKLNVVLDSEILEEISRELSIDIKEFNDAIKLSIISKLKNLKWRPFEEAREFVRRLNLTNYEEWKLYCKNELKEKELKPNDIPSTPNIVYKLNGWNGIKDWLGTTNIYLLKKLKSM